MTVLFVCLFEPHQVLVSSKVDRYVGWNIIDAIQSLLEDSVTSLWKQWMYIVITQ